jgi:hypothetical protein
MRGWTWPQDSGSAASSVLHGTTIASRVYVRATQNLYSGCEYLLLYVNASAAFTLPGFVVEHVSAADPLLLIDACTSAPEAACPDCHTLSARVHSRYTRHLRDLPALPATRSALGG